MRPRTDTRPFGRRAHGRGNARSRHIAAEDRPRQGDEVREDREDRRPAATGALLGPRGDYSYPQPVTLLGEGLGLLGLLGLSGVHTGGVRGSGEIDFMAVGSGLRAGQMKTIMKTEKTLQTIA
jgi:hypothetical protein